MKIKNSYSFRNTFFLFLCISIVLSFTSCEKNKKCIENISLEEIFTVKHNCTYRFSEGNSTLNLSLKDIKDNRSYGAECTVTWGGLAQIHLEINNNTLVFEIRGCQGDTDDSIFSNDLPTQEINGYQVKLMKMYPLSESLNGPPASIDDYELKFVLLKQ